LSHDDLIGLKWSARLNHFAFESVRKASHLYRKVIQLKAIPTSLNMDWIVAAFNRVGISRIGVCEVLCIVERLEIGLYGAPICLLAAFLTSIPSRQKSRGGSSI
jgi:hypothetical protein